MLVVKLYSPTILRVCLVAILLVLPSVCMVGTREVSVVAQGSHVVINEFEPNPSPGLVLGNLGGDQWVELYNPTSSPVNIGGWRIWSSICDLPVGGYGAPPGEGAPPLEIPYGTVLGPGDYYVVTFPYVRLRFENEYIALLDPNYYPLTGYEVDKTPELSDPYGDGRAWARVPNGVGGFVFQKATKGFSNDLITESQITCVLSANRIRVGTSVQISGAITPAQAAPVTIQARNSADTGVSWISWYNLTTINSGADGSYTFSWTPSTVLGAGMETWYKIRASWPGTAELPGKISTPEDGVLLVVGKDPSSITCQISPATIKHGETVRVSGLISPPIEANVTLTYGSPAGSYVWRTIRSYPNGTYIDSYKPEVAGIWNVSAWWPGTWDYSEARSSLTTFNVEALGIEGLSPMVMLILGILAIIAFAAASLTFRAKRPAEPLVKRILPPRVKVRRCAFCRQPLVYDPQRKRYYCQRCRLYP